MRLPNIIALESIDAGGKSTHAALLADYLDAVHAQCECGHGKVHHVGPDGVGLGSGPACHCGCDGFKGKSLPCLRMKFPAYSTPAGKLIAEKLKDSWGCVVGDTYREELPITEARGMKETQSLNALVLQSLMLTNRFECANEILHALTVEGRTVVLDRYSASAFAYGMADGLDYDWLMRIHTRLPKAHHVLIDISVEESFKRRPERMDAYESDKERLRRARINYLHLFERNGVDMSYWQNGLGTGLSGDDQGYRTSPSGWAIVNGLGEVSEVQARIRKALEL